MASQSDNFKQLKVKDSSEKVVKKDSWPKWYHQ